MTTLILLQGRHLVTKAGFVLSGLLLGVTGCTTYVQEPPRRVAYPEPPPPRVVYEERPAPRPVYVEPARVEPAVAVRVEIRFESDFYEPLTPYGRWEIVGNYGRCWIPGRVEADWRPYSNGHWSRTEAGWYWASEEPWGWATYHYGRWDLSPQYGWYWVPQTQWAPAWVSWHEGGGYVGWAPLHPSTRISGGGSVEFDAAVIAPRAYVFVEPRHFLQPVHPSSVVVNNTTIINQTVNITNIKVVNKTVINEGPRTTVIEQASGQRVQPVTVHELRRKEEAPVAARQRTAPANASQPVRVPGRSAVEPINKISPAEPARPVRDPEQKVPAEPSRNAEELQRKAQAEIEQRQREEQKAAQEKSQNAARELARKNKLDAEQRQREEQIAAREKSQNDARELVRKNKLDAEQRQREAQIAAQGKVQNAARELARKKQLDAEQRAKEAEHKPQPEPPKRDTVLEKQAPPELQPHINPSETNVAPELRRPGKEKKNAPKKGVKDPQVKTPVKDPAQPPPEKLVEPPPPKN